MMETIKTMEMMEMMKIVSQSAGDVRPKRERSWFHDSIKFRGMA